ncbi:LANO_0B01816g1_1 [Lachancea nothofagi CBS 11611]|uniref:LANO_0B01816g1_1 n=1 Tax=Lachancea nothofagi CBS 11611 TaxID=1266666 RepID=A0A1G4IVG5_9SACH|nr:LANO_0B01816g1_1 [Lachancea nothofagi CBS 11611]
MSISLVGLILSTAALMFSAMRHMRWVFGRPARSSLNAPVKKMSSTLATLEGHKYPAKPHASKVKEFFLAKKTNAQPSNTAIFIAGEQLEAIKYCDQTKPFRQNRYFFYLTGVNIPGASVLFDFATDKLTLFLPNIDQDDVMWSGLPMSLEEAQKSFDVDEVLFVKDLSEQLKKKPHYEIYTTDLDRVPDLRLFDNLISSDEDLFYALDEARLTKDWYEIQLLRQAAEITDNCHLAVMSALPIEQNEGHMHAEFTYHAIRQGSKHQGYDPICCSGPSCSTLHYVKNDENLEHKHSVLIDAGAEWQNYTADVTRCFPINGKFTKEHREIYEAVLDMQTQVMSEIKPGVSWEKLHLLAHRVLIKRFVKLGIFKSKFSEDEIMSRKASLSFFPHGLGHLLGLDTHDVGGHANYNDPDPLLQYLRLRRPLQEGMIVTNEPGIYFNPFLIKEYLEKHPERLEVVNQNTMQKYMYVGGVRIEDDILVTNEGFDNLTGITSDPDEIEKIVSEGLSKGRSHFHVVA